MDDLRTRLDNLRLEADDCALIARLSADLKQRAVFAKLSVQLGASARDVEQAIKSRSTADNAEARYSRPEDWTSPDGTMPWAGEGKELG